MRQAARGAWCSSLCSCQRVVSAIRELAEEPKAAEKPRKPPTGLRAFGSDRGIQRRFADEPGSAGACAQARQISCCANCAPSCYACQISSVVFLSSNNWPSCKRFLALVRGPSWPMESKRLKSDEGCHISQILLSEAQRSETQVSQGRGAIP